MLWSVLVIFTIGVIEKYPGAIIESPDKCNASILTLTGKETFQTSDYSDHTRNYSSDRAIDGNTKSCSHTCSESKANDWWRIDLLGLYEISCISLYNTDQKNIKMSSAEIYIGNSSEKTGTANKRCTTLHGFNPGTNKTFICDGKPILGRYVTVYQHNSDFVVLCEVQIYGTKKDLRWKLIKENKTWVDALYYCRDRNMDLVSILNEDSQGWVELEAKQANTPFVWLGLHYSCTLVFWFWVDDHRLEYTHWDSGKKIDECDTSAAMAVNGGLWSIKPDNEKLNFICAV
uniref:fucolectin-4-like n=1 Tax=Monopterus albus TaxID=43700 RepID=UPI0009B45F5E|nr:fucolectin-4-like [Monopterus albus]